MKLLFLVVLLLSIYTFSFGQFKFQNDKIENRNFNLTRLFKDLDSAFSISSVNQFEFRFWAISEKRDSIYLFVFTKKNDTLKSRLFASGSYTAKNSQELSVDSKNLNRLWKQLNQYNILTLPDYSLLKTKEGKRPDIHFYDGNHYHFEFFSKNSKKSYAYFCPRAYGEAYPYLKEFTQVQTLIKLLFSYCNLGLKC